MNEHADRLIEVFFRPPREFTSEEADRMAVFVRALAIDEEAT